MTTPGTPEPDPTPEPPEEPEPQPEPEPEHLVLTGGAVDTLLEPTSLTVVPGEVVVAVGRPGHGNVALALALAGRLPLSSGTVTLGGDPEPRRRQRAVVLVDVPGVTEPDDAVPFRVIVGEELALAGLPASRGAATSWLREQHLSDRARARTEDVPAVERLRTLAELGAARPGAAFLVLVSPDRHGLHHRDWWPVAQAAAERGLGVLVTVSDAVDLSGHHLAAGHTATIGPAHRAEEATA
ncbi:hypothetical protein GUY44_13445 [Pimelobacter simplex]|uniref:Uncharacterized protein n=1 Tax=Nocardioides simplex TaxID=2045 RepID=A0A0C5WYJ4_NOCSI|nr:hypothetical protein [Pimelobacter simplex]AJR18373.1 hypothetical protein KR76_11940 [Pimelobacter simplex]MCG8151490.1 hypothetical protein [Pimelobacter simplex]GEB13324.1 hypothetical protein NSI01_16390 [Pimelobacter simplex]SFM46395.1 hypothetical protein SAMN05421671_1707 [Pimelobacter simplex]